MSEANEAFDAIVKAVHAILRPLSFKKSGSTFRRIADDNCQVIGLQRSQTNSDNRVRFTINLGVVSASLHDDWRGPLEKASTADAHLRRRVGDFLPNGDDFWWVLETAADAGPVADEVCSILTDKLVPYLQQHASDSALIAIWSSGESPGITDGHRAKLLAQLSQSSSH